MTRRRDDQYAPRDGYDRTLATPHGYDPGPIPSAPNAREPRCGTEYLAAGLAVRCRTRPACPECQRCTVHCACERST